jgi:hypothetical protein
MMTPTVDFAYFFDYLVTARAKLLEGVIATWYARNIRNDMRAYRACADTVAASLP